MWDLIEGLAKGSISYLLSGMPYVYSLQSLYSYFTNILTFIISNSSQLYRLIVDMTVWNETCKSVWEKIWTKESSRRPRSEHDTQKCRPPNFWSREFLNVSISERKFFSIANFCVSTFLSMKNPWNSNPCVLYVVKCSPLYYYSPLYYHAYNLFWESCLWLLLIVIVLLKHSRRTTFYSNTTITQGVLLW